MAFPIGNHVIKLCWVFFPTFFLLWLRLLLSYRKADIALIGLAVMGQNIILNMDSHGFVVCAYNRTVDKVSISHRLSANLGKLCDVLCDV